MYKWECTRCGTKEVAYEQPYCKGCSHIERIDIKMERNAPYPQSGSYVHHP